MRSLQCLLVVTLVAILLQGGASETNICSSQYYPTPSEVHPISVAFQKCTGDYKFKFERCVGCRGGFLSSTGCTLHTYFSRPDDDFCTGIYCERRRRIAELEYYSRSPRAGDIYDGSTPECEKLRKLLAKAVDDAENECLAVQCNSDQKDCPNIEEACKHLGQLYAYFNVPQGTFPGNFDKAPGIVLYVPAGVVLEKSVQDTTKQYLAEFVLQSREYGGGLIPNDILMYYNNHNNHVQYWDGAKELQIYVPVSKYISELAYMFFRNEWFSSVLAKLGVLSAKDSSGTRTPMFGECTTMHKDIALLQCPTSTVQEVPDVSKCLTKEKYCTCLGYNFLKEDVAFCTIPSGLDRKKVKQCSKDHHVCTYYAYKAHAQKHASTCPQWSASLEQNKDKIMRALRCQNDFGFSPEALTEVESKQIDDVPDPASIVPPAVTSPPVTYPSGTAPPPTYRNDISPPPSTPSPSTEVSGAAARSSTTMTTSAAPNTNKAGMIAGIVVGAVVVVGLVVLGVLFYMHKKKALPVPPPSPSNQTDYINHELTDVS